LHLLSTLKEVTAFEKDSKIRLVGTIPIF
jgi:hypothetical protein